MALDDRSLRMLRAISNGNRVPPDQARSLVRGGYVRGADGWLTGKGMRAAGVQTNGKRQQGASEARSVAAANHFARLAGSRSIPRVSRSAAPPAQSGGY